MARPILPFSIKNEDPKTPLSVAPYNSIVLPHQLDAFADAKNYKYVAFRPGYPLQAAELNEIQEYFYLEQSLFAFMVNAWGAFSGEPFSGSGDEETGRRYAGPGWAGATPVSPYNNIEFSQISFDGAGGIVIDPLNYPAFFNDIPDLVDVVDLGDALRITFNDGFYFSEIKTGTQVDNGFKYMVYLNSSLGAYTVTIPKRESGVTNVGLTMVQRYVKPTTMTNPEQGADSTLNDNSSGFYNDVAAGAARVEISFQQIGVHDPDGVDGLSLFSPSQVADVLYIDHGESEVRYMNGLPVFVTNALNSSLTLGSYGGAG